MGLLFMIGTNISIILCLAGGQPPPGSALTTAWLLLKLSDWNPQWPSGRRRDQTRQRFLFLLDAVIRLNSADANCPGPGGGSEAPPSPLGRLFASGAGVRRRAGL